MRCPLALERIDASLSMPRDHSGPASVDQLARRKSIEHIKTIEEIGCDGVFDSDEEVEEFLAFVTEQRHANLA
jgi:hypothetical protein